MIKTGRRTEAAAECRMPGSPGDAETPRARLASTGERGAVTREAWKRVCEQQPPRAPEKNLSGRQQRSRLHRDPNQPLRSKRSPVLSQVSDILGASHHGEASPLSWPSELFATWRAFPFRFPSIRHRSPLNNPVLLAASTFCPCGAFCLDAHPSALAGTASSVGLSARTISCCPHSAQSLTSACKATCGRHLNVRNDRCPGEKSACIDGSHCERRVPASPHFSRCERRTFCITYSDLLPGKRAPKSHRVADLGMGQVGREGLSFNHTSGTLEQLTFPTAMGPVTSCRLLFVGCESADAAATLTQEVLRSSHGHACFRLPFKRMSFFIPGGCLRLEPGSATEQLPLCTCAAAICRSVSLGTQTGFGDETGSVTKAVQLPSTPLPRLENHHRFSGAQQWRERTPQVPGPVETERVCTQLQKAGRDHARCTVVCKEHTTARGCLTCTRGGGAHQERQDPEKYREALVLKRVSPAERRACGCPRGRPAQLPMSGLTADVTDPSQKALPREAAPCDLRSPGLPQGLCAWSLGATALKHVCTGKWTEQLPPASSSPDPSVGSSGVELCCTLGSRPRLRTPAGELDAPTWRERPGGTRRARGPPGGPGARPPRAHPGAFPGSPASPPAAGAATPPPSRGLTQKLPAAAAPAAPPLLRAPRPSPRGPALAARARGAAAPRHADRSAAWTRVAALSAGKLAGLGPEMGTSELTARGDAAGAGAAGRHPQGPGAGPPPPLRPPPLSSARAPPAPGPGPGGPVTGQVRLRLGPWLNPGF
ncbi:hypothetical protein R6Z07M_002009 [Ovis aries]